VSSREWTRKEAFERRLLELLEENNSIIKENNELMRDIKEMLRKIVLNTS
jgi:hypothetical protein